MSAPAPPSSCPTCGEDAATDARFCANCGARLAGEDSTAVIPPPPHETGPVPVAVVTSEPRLFGVLPAGLLLVVTLAVLAVAIALFVAGRWVLGLVLLGFALLGLAGAIEAARRVPDALGGRRVSEGLRRLSGWAGFAVTSYAARSRARRDVVSWRHRLGELEARRNALLTALGEAAYREDEPGVGSARERLHALDEEAARMEHALAEAVALAETRIRQARLEVQPTEMVQVPEPYPPPDEGTPRLPEPVPEPSPPQVPEPYPPPDEGSPPSEPPVPESAPPRS